MNIAPLGFTRDGKAIMPTKPGMITTQAFIHCEVCGTAIKATGGPKSGSRCPEHASVRLLLQKSYSAEELCDVERDVSEAFSEDFTPEARGIPVDAHGFCEGSYVVTVKWVKS